MQLSLVDEVPELSKTHFLNVFAEASFDEGKDRMRLKTITGQQIPVDLSVSIPDKFISRFPEGTIYKLDTRLIMNKGKKPYFVALRAKQVQRAIEYFDYNLKLQYGFEFKYGVKVY